MKLSERGSAIIMLFIAIALFGALAIAFMQGSRGNLGMIMDEADNAEATQSQDCTNTINMATKRLLAKGCGSLISSATDGSNTNAGAPTDGSCSIYHTNGGGVKPCIVVASAPADCTGLGAEHYNDSLTGHCYYRDETRTPTDAAAQASCASNGAYLATVTSAAEQTIIDNIFQNNMWYRLGGKDDVIEGEWRWAYGAESGQQFWQGSGGGSPVNGMYNNWTTGEPNNSGGNEHCQFIGYSGSTQWFDENCTTDNPAGEGFMCEINGSP